MLATVNSGALIGVDAHPVQVEVNTGEVGEPRIFMVGLPDAAVKESTDRVKSALMNCGYKAPQTRTTINLAPGSIRKEGPMYDLPIALGLLASTGQLGLLDRVAARLRQFLVAGELGLSGEVRPVRGGLALARLARKRGISGVILPIKSAGEAALVDGVQVIPVRSLDHAVTFLLGQTDIPPLQAKDSPFHRNSAASRRSNPAQGTQRHAGQHAQGGEEPQRSATPAGALRPTAHASGSAHASDNEGSGIAVAEAAPEVVKPVAETTENFAYEPDFAEVKGQATVRRAVEIAVAGGHNILLVGPPGSGKSMIARRIPGIMPAPSLDEFLEILAVQSAAGLSLDSQPQTFSRPFRSPHHTISEVGLIGGGSNPGPGELSLAHYGVLFLDELPEFRRATLEVLRQPLEDGEVTISRSAAKVTLPAAAMLVAAMNPCPCGYLGDPRHECRCTPTLIQRYRARISGPLLDRIDLHVEAPALTFDELRSTEPGESSTAIRARVENARATQSQRYNASGDTATCNARMSHRELRRHCALTQEQGDLLQQALEELSLSARAFDRILKVARTIADLECSERIETGHLLEAIQYRSLDRRLFY